MLYLVQSHLNSVRLSPRFIDYPRLFTGQSLHSFQVQNRNWNAVHPIQSQTPSITLHCLLQEGDTQDGPHLA